VLIFLSFFPVMGLVLFGSYDSASYLPFHQVSVAVIQKDVVRVIINNQSCVFWRDRQDISLSYGIP